jgi:hypothetical protein
MQMGYSLIRHSHQPNYRQRRRGARLQQDGRGIALRR